MRTVIPNLIWNQRFLYFCGFYGIKPTRSLPAHPWSKGKVESPFAYLETHFIMKTAISVNSEARLSRRSSKNRLSKSRRRITNSRIPPQTRLFWSI